MAGAGSSPTAAVDEAAEGVDGEPQLGADESLPQPRLGEGDAGVGREAAAFEQAGVEAVEAVAGALGLALAVEGDDGAVAGADQFLELALGLLDAARRGLGAGGAEGVLVVLAGRGQRQCGALGQRRGDVDVEMLGVVGVHRRRRVLPVVAQRRLDLLGGGEHDRRRLRHQFQRRPEVSSGSASARFAASPSSSRRHRRQLGQFAVLGVELGGRRQLDPLGLAQRALGEGREPAQRVDLVAEQLDPHRPLLGRRVDVENAAADGELAALGRPGRRVRSRRRRGPRRPRRARSPRRGRSRTRPAAATASGTASASAVALATTTASCSRAERVEGVDPQPDEVRRRRHVRGVAGPPRGVEADPPRRQVSAQVGGQVAAGAVVGGDQQRRPAGEAAVVFEQRRQQQRPQRRRDPQRLRLPTVGRRPHAAAERVQALVLGGDLY